MFLERTNITYRNFCFFTFVDKWLKLVCLLRENRREESGRVGREEGRHLSLGSSVLSGYQRMLRLAVSAVLGLRRYCFSEHNRNLAVL